MALSQLVPTPDLFADLLFQVGTVGTPGTTKRGAALRVPTWQSPSGDSGDKMLGQCAASLALGARVTRRAGFTPTSAAPSAAERGFPLGTA